MYQLCLCVCGVGRWQFAFACAGCACVCVYAQRRLSALSGDVCPAVDVSLCGPVTITTSALLPSHLPTSPWHLFVLVVVIIIVVDLVVVALGFSSYHTL